MDAATGAIRTLMRDSLVRTYLIDGHDVTGT
jgi:hypothetical protein